MSASEEETHVDTDNDQETEETETLTFRELGVTEVLCEACDLLGWKKATKIQSEAIPFALKGKDIIGVAETGSGKTGAFALPILQSLLENPQKLFALILTPTRELAQQISQHFEALGESIGVKSAIIVGGMDMVTQAATLQKKPHIVIATPGRLVDHLENTKGFNLRSIKYLVLDEADRILNMDFELDVDKILKALPKERRTYLFSATMTKKVKKLQRAALKDPKTVEAKSKYRTVEKLKQFYMLTPLDKKDLHLIHLVKEMEGNSFMIFCATCVGAMKMTFLLRKLGFAAVPLHGQMDQNKRFGALNKFKAQDRSILVSTDVASRGLDIPHVDVVINFDPPASPKDYVHRVGRTARAGRSGKAITFFSQYDWHLCLKIEEFTGKKMEVFSTEKAEVEVLRDTVAEAQRLAKLDMKEWDDKQRDKKRGRNKRRQEGDNDDTDQALGVRKRFKHRGGKNRK